jgi:hypothetical protein
MKSGDQRWAVGWKQPDGKYVWDSYEGFFGGLCTPVLFQSRQSVWQYIKREYGYNSVRTNKPQAVRVRVKLEVV